MVDWSSLVKLPSMIVNKCERIEAHRLVCTAIQRPMSRGWQGFGLNLCKVCRGREKAMLIVRGKHLKKAVDDETYLKQVHLYLKDTLLDSFKTQG